jgi:hypothetical protein
MRRAGDRESTGVAVQIRAARFQKSKIEELSGLEFELLGFLEKESSGTGTERFLSLQLCFVARHTLFLLVLKAHKVPSADDSPVEDIELLFR